MVLNGQATRCQAPTAWNRYFTATTVEKKRLKLGKVEENMLPGWPSGKDRHRRLPDQIAIPYHILDLVSMG
jgi:hypothetical protein